jgi:hypothetical protein
MTALARIVLGAVLAAACAFAAAQPVAGREFQLLLPARPVSSGDRIEVLHSEQVNAQVAAAKKALDTYDVKVVPTFVIDGKYLTSSRMTGSVKDMMPVIEFLVARAADERRK